MSRHAFTLIEIITTLVILSLLATIATPMYLDHRADANRSAERYTVGAVETAIYNQYMKNRIQGSTTWPTTLDSAPAYSSASSRAPFFSVALQTPVTSGWTKGSTATTYVGPAGTIYYYDPTTGRFSTTRPTTTPISPPPTTWPTSYPATQPTTPPPASPVV